jgi:hypothetical protein
MCCKYKWNLVLSLDVGIFNVIIFIVMYCGNFAVIVFVLMNVNIFVFYSYLFVLLET